MYAATSNNWVANALPSKFPVLFNAFKKQVFQSAQATTCPIGCLAGMGA
jgi:hypothetical protein